MSELIKRKELLKRLFHKHEYNVPLWHWTHGITGNEPRMMEAKIICKYCGKEKFIYPERNSADELYIIQNGKYIG